MNKDFLKDKVIHFTGIGGIGMSSIAIILNELGHAVQGSDIKASANTDRLQRAGIKIFITQEASNVDGADTLVVSTAINQDNPEITAARQQDIPIVKRADMLAFLMQDYRSIAVAGTHGKTTTTALLYELFSSCKQSPTVVNGGIINNISDNGKLGEGEFLIAEADESDGSLLSLPMEGAIITNIDSDHLDHHGDFDNICKCFRSFIGNLPFYGFAVLCEDDAGVQTLMQENLDRTIYTYSTQNKGSDVFGHNIELNQDGFTFDVKISDKFNGDPQEITNITLPMHGLHNVQNALATIAVALHYGFDLADIQAGFEKFEGVQRRFTHVGYVSGASIIDDYAHHPLEIKLTIDAAYDICDGKVLAIIQPHRYSRLQAFFDDYVQAVQHHKDLEVIILDIFAAGEPPITGITSQALTNKMIAQGINAKYMPDTNTLYKHLSTTLTTNDTALFMGAGSITTIARNLAELVEG